MDKEMTKKQGIQVVFLIDTNQFYENKGNKKLLNNAFRAISISVLRVLTYLAHREDSDRNKFAWGCQFFKIPSNTHFYSRRSAFREFTRNAFEDFEKQLEEEIFVTGKQKFNQKEKQEGFEVSPAFSLKYALHDASLEYRWDELVLSSPLKVSKQCNRKSNVTKSSDSETDDGQTKFVFAILPCPLTSNDLECFCEHRSQFTPSFLKRTLINTGKQESYLFDNLKASLFWLDSRNLWSFDTRSEANNTTTTASTKGIATSSRQDIGLPEEVVTENQDGYNMINETLSLVRGGVIPLTCLTNIGGLESSSISQLLDVPSVTQTNLKNLSSSEGGKVSQETKTLPQDTITTVSPALPYSSCLNFYTFQQFSGDNNGTLGATRADEIIVPLSDLRDMSSGPKCLLKMKNLWKSHPKKRLSNSVETDARNSSSLSSRIYLSWSQSDDPAGTTPNLQHCIIQSESEEISSEGVKRSSLPQNENINEDLRAFILAVVPKESLTLDLYQSSQVLSCLGFEVPNETGENSVPAGSKLPSSKWFEQMLFHLCRKKSLLVLHLFDYFAVLEPLTPVMASIRFIHSTKVMTLEKSLAFDGAPFSGSEQRYKAQETSGKEDLSTLGEKDVTGTEPLKNKFNVSRLRELPDSDSSPNAEPKEIGKSATKCPLDLNLHKDSKSLKSFSPNCFEPWYRDLPNRGVSAKFLEQLVSWPECLLLDESVNLDSALSQLKQLYKSEQNLPPSQEVEKECPEESNPAETTKQNVIQGKSNDILQQYKPRTLSILKSIRRVELTRPKDPPKKTKPSQKEVIVPFVPDKEFSSEEDLVAYVQEAYTAAISVATSSLSSAQQIVSLTVHFFKEHPHDNADIPVAETVKNFLTEYLFQSNAELITKYSSSDAEDSKIMRRREAQLQSLLRFELEVAFPTAADQKGQGEVKSKEGDEKRQEAREVTSEGEEDGEPELPEEIQETVDEISPLLSSIPILGDYEELLTFLDDVVLPSYSDTIPYLVKAVFEELGHPVPDHLMSPGSSKPASVKPPSSYQGIRSWGSMDMAPAASTRSRTWSRHPSLADIGQKRLIIQPNKAKAKHPLKKQKEAEMEARKARRNLFSDSNKLTRRESVAVMEGISQPRRQSPRKQAHGHRHSKVLKTRVVRETPGKRQVSQALLFQARRARKLEERFIGRSLSPTVEVIEESPVKPVAAGSAPRSFHPPPKKQLAFYSENRGNSRQDKLQEARNFTARITGSSPVDSTDIVKKVKMKKSPARSFLKEVCTPSTLGSLRRLRSSKKSIGLGGSPELKRNDEDEQASKRKKFSEWIMLPPKEIIAKADSKVPSKTTPRKRLCLESEDETKDKQQKDSEGKVRDKPGDDTGTDQKELLMSKQEQYPAKRTSLRTSLKRMFDGAAKRSPQSDVKDEEEGKVTGESVKVSADETAMSITGFSGDAREVPMQEQDGQASSSTTISAGSQENGTSETPAAKKRKIKNDSPRLQVLSAGVRSGRPTTRTPSPRRKATELLASPEMFKQWPRRKLRSTTPSPKGIFRGQKPKESRGSTGKVFSTNQSPGIGTRDNEQSMRHLKTRSKTSLNFTEQSSGEKNSGQLQMPSKNSSNEELERHFSFTSDDDEIEFIKINRSGSRDSMGRTLSSDGEGCSKDGQEGANSLSPVFSGSQSSVEVASPPSDQSKFKSPASRTRSKTPSKNLKQEGKSTSPVFHFVSTPSTSGIKVTLRKQYKSPGEKRKKTPDKSLSTTDGGSASTGEDSQSELESAFSHLSSENDEVFSSLCHNESKQKTVSTPPGSSAKMNCKLSTKGLYDLLHSPFAGSPAHRMKPKQTISVSRKRTRKVIIQDQIL